MKQGIVRMALAGALGAPLAGNAAGFGEIVLHSRIGEPLRAEVAVSGGNEVDTACYTLASVPGSDLPVIAQARIKLVRENGQRRLLITGTQPINDPLFMLALRAQCGVDLKRDFALMPSAPVAPVQAPIQATAIAAPAALPTSRDWVASDGETLAGIAEVLAPDNPAQQRSLLAGLRRANPGLSANAPLTAGTAVAMPDLNRKPAPAASEQPARAPAKPAVKKPAAKRESSPPPKPAAKPESKPQPTLAPPAPAKPGGTGDRVVLAAPAEEALPPAKNKEATDGAPPAPRTPQEFEERIRKLEATLQVLNQEIEQTNKVLELATEALSAQQKLQAAQAAQGTLTPPAGGPPATRDERSPALRQWLELLISAVLGGLVVAGAVFALTRRRPAAGREEFHGQPAAQPDFRPAPVPVARPIAPSAPLPAAANSVMPSERPAVSEARRPAVRSEEVRVSYDDRDSALELAEIMLSFGRLQGAADTLNEYIESHAPTQPQAWLMLLDLYRRGNMEAEYTRLAPRIRERFNASVPDWNDAPALVSGLKSLESYTHIVKHLTDAWGSQDSLDYLLRLINDNRDGQRAGFPLEVVEEIALLVHVLEQGHALKRAA